MEAFNAFYYSFSPGVASFVASHSDVRTSIRIVLYPLIGILYLSSLLFDLFSFNAELAVTLSGIFASLGIGLVYLGPVTAIMSRHMKRRELPRRWTIGRSLFTTAFLSLGVLFLAELSRLNLLLTVSAVILVLSFAAIGIAAFEHSLRKLRQD